MSDYIKREDAIKAFCDGCMLRGKCKLDEVYCSNRKKLNEIPAADVRENVHGEYEVDQDPTAVKRIPLFCSRCSVCGYVTPILNYCGKCGAETRGETDGA